MRSKKSKKNMSVVVSNSTSKPSESSASTKGMSLKSAKVLCALFRFAHINGNRCRKVLQSNFCTSRSARFRSNVKVSDLSPETKVNSTVFESRKFADKTSPVLARRNGFDVGNVCFSEPSTKYTQVVSNGLSKSANTCCCTSARMTSELVT